MAVAAAAAAAVNIHNYVWLGVKSGRDDAGARTAAELSGYLHDKATTGNWVIFPGYVVEISFGKEGPIQNLFVTDTWRSHCDGGPLDGWGESSNSVCMLSGLLMDMDKSVFVGPLVTKIAASRAPRNDSVSFVVDIISDNIKTPQEVVDTVQHFGGVRHPETAVKIYDFAIERNNFNSTDLICNFFLYRSTIDELH